MIRLLLPLLQHLPFSLTRQCLANAIWHLATSSYSEISYVPLLQFQSFSQYRGKMAHKTAHELELLRDCVGVWDVNTVLQILQSLIDKSQVGQKLGNEGEQSVSEAPVMRAGRVCFDCKLGLVAACSSPQSPTVLANGAESLTTSGSFFGCNIEWIQASCLELYQLACGMAAASGLWF